MLKKLLVAILACITIFLSKRTLDEQARPSLERGVSVVRSSAPADHGHGEPARLARTSVAFR